MEDLRKLAQTNKNGYPFSARIFEKSTGRSIVSVNQVITKRDPTAHAEMEAIRKAGENGFNFKDCTITCSGEPCPMCAGATYQCGISRVVYGCSAQGLRDVIGRGRAIPCREIFERVGRSVEVLGPLLEDEGLSLHRHLRCWATA